MISRLYHVAVSALTAAGLVFWLLHLTYPAWLPGVLMAAGVMLLVCRPAAWLVLVPALWPVIDFVPGTGQMYLAESDALAMLCIAVLGFHQLSPQPQSGATAPNRISLACVVLLAGIALSYAISSIYALTPLPALDDNAFASYASAFNSLRLSKGILWALLFLPHWFSLRKQRGAGADTLLRIGMTLGLTSVSLAALWDRAAFNGILDFATDYRTTALFWEMHVGGAALDGWLMLTLPFAVAGLLQVRRPLAIILHIIVLALGAYAVLTTFSRGVYLGCGVMLLCVLPAWWRGRGARSQHNTSALDENLTGLRKWLAPAVVVAGTAAAIPVFHGGGYRGLGAMFVAAGMVYLAGGLLRRAAPMRLATWLPVLCVAGVASALCYGLHDQFPKAAYWLFAVALASTLVSSFFAWRQATAATHIPLAIGAIWCAAGTGWVGWYWGGDAALPAGLLASALLGLLLVAQTMAARPIWTLGREQAATAMIAGVVALMIAVGAGSYFVGSRFSSVGQDLQGRLRHWKHGIDLIHDNGMSGNFLENELLFGIGTGRYAERYFWQAPIDEIPGIWRIARDESSPDGDNAVLHLVGPRFPMGANQLLRVSQRIGLDVRGPFAITLRARAQQGVSLKLEVCQKHLLYAGNCASAAFVAVPGGNVWTEIHQRLSDKPLADNGRWYAPQFVNFAIAIRDQGQVVDVDDIDLRDAAGNSLLENGGFAKGADDWFFSSDRIHLPYHAKSIFIHLLVEQGVFGLLAVALTCLTAMMRLGFGRGSHDPAAPVLLAALGGFLTVGLFDSLLDVPRDAVFFFLLLGIALSMRAPTHSSQKP